MIHSLMPGGTHGLGQCYKDGSKVETVRTLSADRQLLTYGNISQYSASQSFDIVNIAAS